MAHKNLYIYFSMCKFSGFFYIFKHATNYNKQKLLVLWIIMWQFMLTPKLQPSKSSLGNNPKIVCV